MIKAEFVSFDKSGAWFECNDGSSILVYNYGATEYMFNKNETVEQLIIDNDCYEIWLERELIKSDGW